MDCCKHPVGVDRGDPGVGAAMHDDARDGAGEAPMAAWAARPWPMGSSLPRAIAVKAAPTLAAERYASPECTATAANRSG